MNYSKLCINCFYYKEKEESYDLNYMGGVTKALNTVHRCLYPKEVITKDHVVGITSKIELRYCYKERDARALVTRDQCGRQGQYWREKEYGK